MVVKMLIIEPSGQKSIPEKRKKQCKSPGKFKEKQDYVRVEQTEWKCEKGSIWAIRAVM